MTYEVRHTSRFDRDFKKVPKDIKKRIYNKCEVLTSNPRAGKILKRRMGGLWSLRVGDYRVIYHISNKIVYLVAI